MRCIEYVFVFSLFMMAGCDSKNDLPGAPPLADAGPDIEEPICFGTILLDGSASSDPDGDTLIYSWTITSAPATSSATINNDSESKASITPDAEGEYVITLTVHDGVHPQVTDQTKLTITPDTGHPPTADAGEDRTVGINETVTLNGSNSSDPDGDPLIYQWTISSTPVGSQATLANPDHAQAQFVPDKAGNYIFRLKVTDAAGNCKREATDNLTITAE